jgi:hypothetical protein
VALALALFLLRCFGRIVTQRHTALCWRTLQMQYFAHNNF